MGHPLLAHLFCLVVPAARAWGLAVVLIVLTVAAPRAAELKIATWNLNWLTTRQAGLPGGQNPGTRGF